ncbi:MAG TPA: PEP/pyruvate-binding domain-containing protein [Terriglobales bacterium]|nr:PEP/pyruvate-binding domain-containing protein [Terriglobales bacterium]
MFILWPAQIDNDAAIGGKARALLRLTCAELPVPDWFVVTSGAFDASLPRTAGPALPAADPDAVGEALEGLAVAPVVREELTAALRRLCPAGEFVAVRSSALEEDSAARSFAGQLESYVFVPPGDVPARLADVWRSGFSPRLLAYRRAAGLETWPMPPAVIVQRVVDADVSGVAFSADPISGRRGIAVVSAVLGQAEALVQGEVDADTWHVDRAGAIVAERIGAKSAARRRNETAGRGLRLEPVDPVEGSRPALEPAALIAIAGLARRAERLFGRPQDIEWARERGRLFFLQSRPITTLADKPDPDAARVLWDNSNIVENYSGVTTPLTFSVARMIYERVFREFYRHMGVPSQMIDAHAGEFRGMIGLVRGRMYYNLSSWYRVLALLPGFKVNRAFLEQMLGVARMRPGPTAVGAPAPTARDRFVDLLRLVRTTCGLPLNYLLLRREIHRFLHTLDAFLDEKDTDLGSLRPDELAAHYRHLERHLGAVAWLPPLNDFFVMTFHGFLRAWARRWIGVDDPGRLLNDLLRGGRQSLAGELAARVASMARLAMANEQLVCMLCDGALPAIEQSLRGAPALESEYREYLTLFGERCVEELKLESPTLHDDPLPLLRSIGQVARRLQAGAEPAADAAAAAEAARTAAEARVARAIGRNPWRRPLFAWILANARARLRARERLRFARTRVFGRARRILIELGRRLAALEILDEPRDVFYLEAEEILAFVEGWATTRNLRGLAALRQLEFQAFEAGPPPADRFETVGIPYVGRQETAVPQPSAQPDDEGWQGLGCCAGIVTGPVCIVRDPRRANLRPGAIIVAERTDPGWTVIFPAAAGLLVERGNLLSHAAIVAREIGLPMIVSLPGVMDWLHDGDEVQMDGTSGRVIRLRPTPVGEPVHA